MVSSQEDDLLWVLHLIAEQKLDGFNRVIAPVHKIPDEDVPGLWQFTPDIKQLLNIIELAVDVAADDGGRGSFLDIGLFKKEFFDFVAESADGAFVKIFALFEHGNPFIDFSHNLNMIV